MCRCFTCNCDCNCFCGSLVRCSDNLPKTFLFVRVAVSVVPTLVSTSVSNSCNAVFTVLLFVIVEPVKVPRWSLDSETPDKVISGQHSNRNCVGTSM